MQNETRRVRGRAQWRETATRVAGIAVAFLLLSSGASRKAEAQKKPDKGGGGGGTVSPQLCAQSTSPGTISVQTVCPSDDALEPIITIAPSTSSFTSSAVSVTIDWCDNKDLSSSTRSLKLNGQSITIGYTSSAKTGCVAHGSSTATLTLAVGNNLVEASIADLAGNQGYNSVGYTFSPPPPPPPPPPQPGPLVSLAPYSGDHRNIALCALDCGEMVVSYSTPSYTSRDEPRSVTLLYRSDRAAPTPVVQLDARDTTAIGATQLGLRLKDSTGMDVPLMYGSPEIVRNASPGQLTRLAVQVDARTWSSGVYNLTAIVTAYKPDGGTPEVATRPVRVLVDNASNSPFGAGVEIVGMQHFTWATDGSGLLISAGDGSMAYFALSSTVGTKKTFTAPTGDFSSVVYYSDSTLLRRTYLDGTVVRFNVSGNEITAADRYGNTTTFTYNGSSQLTAITDPAGKVTTLGYETATGSPWRMGGLRVISDPGGRASWIDILPSNDWQAAMDPAGVHAFVATYGTNHRIATRLDRGEAGQWSYGYDFAGAIASVTSPAVMAEGTSRSLVITSLSPQRAVLVDPATALGSAGSPASALLSADVRARVTNARGFTTAYQLDRFGAPTRIEEPLGRVSQIARDTLGRPVQTTSPSGHVIQYTYVGPDLTSTLDGTTGQSTTMTYEPAYHELATRSGTGMRPVWLTWSGGYLSYVDVDSVGPTYRTSFGYTGTGRVQSITDPRGHVTSFTFDATGFQNRSSATAAGRTTTFAYDAYGRRRTATDAAGNVTTTVYDSLNRVTMQVGAANDTTALGYNMLYRTSVRDSKGQVYRFAPNALGWVETRTDPALRTESASYDRNGNVVGTVNRRGQAVSFTYDALDQLQSLTADGRTAMYATDPAQLFTAAQNGESTDTLKLDAAGRLVREISVRGAQRYELISSYNTYGVRTSLQISQPWGSAIGYHYNARALLDTLTDLAGGKTAISYDDDQEPARVVLPTSPALGATFAYPATHMPAQIGYSTQAVESALGVTYAFGATGGIEKRTITAQTTSSQEVGRRYNYDALGQLRSYEDYTQTTGGGTSTYLCAPGTAYTFDPVTGQPCWGPPPAGTYTVSASATYSPDKLGNRTDLGAQLDVGNRLIQFNGVGMKYDEDGNLTRRWTVASGDTTQKLYWNSLGQLDSVWTKNVGLVQFGYDAFGRRTRKTVNGVSMGYVHDGENLFAELDAAGARVADYTYYPGVDQPHSVRRWSGGVATTYYYAAESPGSVAGLISAAGQVAARYRYSPFGVLQDSTGSLPNPLRFDAREFDGETGLYFNRARYYDPTLGRFISEDPIGLAGGINLYRFAGGDPVNATDPSGRECITFYVPPAYISAGAAGTSMFMQWQDPAHTNTVCFPFSLLPPDGYSTAGPNGAGLRIREAQQRRAEEQARDARTVKKFVNCAVDNAAEDLQDFVKYDKWAILGVTAGAFAGGALKGCVDGAEIGVLAAGVGAGWGCAIGGVAEGSLYAWRAYAGLTAVNAAGVASYAIKSAVKCTIEQ